MPTLHHTPLTAGDTRPSRWLLLLHGIYGSGRNWASVARRLVEQRPEWGVLLADLRLHGGSTGFEPPHTLEAVTGDVRALLEELGVQPAAVLGHSYGGKVALEYARTHPAGLSQVWVVDSTLAVKEPSGSAWQLIHIVRSLPAHFSSRDALVEALAPHGYPRAVGHWLGMNLERRGDAFRWKLDWGGVEEMLRDYHQADVWGVIERPPPGIEIHVVRAAESDALDEADMERIRRAGDSTFLHELAGGHWVNVDNPEGMLSLIAGSLP